MNFFGIMMTTNNVFSEHSGHQCDVFTKAMVLLKNDDASPKTLCG